MTSPSASLAVREQIASARKRTSIGVCGNACGGTACRRGSPRRHRARIPYLLQVGCERVL
eukprot:2088611-Prymnesium_polylepis.1